MMSEYETLLKNALANIDRARNQVIEQIEKEHEKDQPNEARIYHLTDYKIEMLDQKLRLQGLIKNLHLIEEQS